MATVLRLSAIQNPSEAICCGFMNRAQRRQAAYRTARERIFPSGLPMAGRWDSSPTENSRGLISRAVRCKRCATRLRDAAAHGTRTATSFLRLRDCWAWDFIAYRLPAERLL